MRIDTPEFFDALLEYAEAYCGDDSHAVAAKRQILIALVQQQSDERANSAINQTIVSVGNLDACKAASPAARAGSGEQAAHQITGHVNEIGAIERYHDTNGLVLEREGKSDIVILMSVEDVRALVELWGEDIVISFARAPSEGASHG